MSPIIISVAAFIGVAALVGGVAVLFRGDGDAEVEERLSILTGKNKGERGKKGPELSLLATSIEGSAGVIEKAVARICNLSLLFEQADVRLTMPKFLAICAGCGLVSAVISAYAGLSIVIAPLVAVSMGFLPVLWLVMRRKRRLKKFAAQLPDALELISRALRAGHSLAAGFNLVSGEMSEPIGKEFGRVFEEQNLGIPFEEALEHLTESGTQPGSAVLLDGGHSPATNGR